MPRIFLVLILATACMPAAPQGQFGPYIPGHEKHLILEDNHSLTIYRIKYWTFASGEPPAVQVEYEALDSLDNIEALRHRAVKLWPAFAPYIETAGVRTAIVTATKLKRRGIVGFGTLTMKHYGLTLNRDSLGTWRFEDDHSTVPPADFKRGPQIIEFNGQALPFNAWPQRMAQ